MIRLTPTPLNSVGDAYIALQTAIQIEFGTLPPYLYALYSIRPGTNVASAERIKSIAMQEMVHFCLDCNILNAIGGSPVIARAGVVPTYPGWLPGHVGGAPIHLYPFSPDAIQQGMDIETPEDPIEFPALAAEAAPTITIGEYYARLDTFLATLPADVWQPNRNQITDSQYFVGNLFAVNSYEDAHRAISDIVSEGEGTSNDPLDFQGEVAHYYRFEEIARNQVLTKADNPVGYAWGAPLGVDYGSAYPAIPDPGSYDFSGDPAARAAQDACNAAYTTMLLELERAVNGESGRLGIAIRAMFDLRMAAIKALSTPLVGSTSVAGPAFQFLPPNRSV